MPIKLPKYVVALSVIGTGAGAYVLLNDAFGSNRYQGKERIPGKTVVITGTTSGLGRYTAMEMAKRGGRVIMGCRNIPECEKVKKEIMEVSYNKDVFCHKLDLASLESVRQFADAINSQEKRVDILINNAGVMTPERTVTSDGFELHLGVNYLGPYLLTHLLLDKLKTSAPSRIINVGSFRYESCDMNFHDFNLENEFDIKDAYMRSKKALAMFTKYLSENELKDTQVSTYLVIPGLADTKLMRNMPMKKSYFSSVILRPLWYFTLFTPGDAAYPILHCALSAEESENTGLLYLHKDKQAELQGKSTDSESRKRLDAISKLWTRRNS